MSFSGRIGSGVCVLLASLAIAIVPGCSCSKEPRLPATTLQQVLPCVPQHAQSTIALAPDAKTVTTEALPMAFWAGALGDAMVSMALGVPPGPMQPALELQYSSSGESGGFGVSAGSAITRCPKSEPLDGVIGSVRYDDSDLESLCLDGKRLVVIGKTGSTIEYRLIPDAKIRVVGHFENMATSYFEAFWPDGTITTYATTEATRPMATESQPRAWLADERRDPRGNLLRYGWCFAENEDGSVAEYALDQLEYGGFEDEEPTRAITFVHEVKPDVAVGFSGGMRFQQSLRVSEIQMSVDGALAQRYHFDYAQGETTGRTRLTSVEKCGSNGICTLPTRMQYSPSAFGFDEVVTNIDAPFSSKASPILADFNADGLADWFVPDTTPLSTPSNPITEWTFARNMGKGFAAPNVAFSQEWSFVQDPEGPSDPTQLQPELGTVLQYNVEDQRADILLHDIYNNRQNFIVLQSQPDNSFVEVDTGIARPFPAGPAPKHLRGANGATHLLDANGDSMQDLVICDDHSSTPETAALPTWTLHLWKPGGWDKAGEVIEELQGYPCSLEVYTLDSDRNGTTDLVVPGMIKQGGSTLEKAPNFYVFRRNTNATWESFDTNLQIPQGRVLFGDFNGDGLPDALAGDGAGRLLTWMNTGKGFAEQAENALEWDGLLPQTKYFHLAATADFDQNGQSDILLPLADAISPNVPRWVILRAGGGAYTFERMESGIPFEPLLGEAIELADPRGPRIGNINGDAAPDVAINLGNQVHLFVNRAGDQDVLIGFSDGMTDHDPDEPGFIPNVAISYGYLTDEWFTNGEVPNDPKKEEYLYLSQADATNDSTYPRGYAVGSRRVVRAYATNDGLGGQRHFELKYRDGRFDRRGYGFLGFGERILTDLDTGATTATFYDNETLVDIGRKMYPFAGQAKSQWRWAPALPNEPNPKRVEMLFTDNLLDVVPTNGGQSYFTLSTQRHTRRMQGEHVSNDSLETWVRGIEANENATMLRNTTVDVTDFDEYGNALKIDVSTVGVDLTFGITRTVKNDVNRWILGQLQSQKECSAASGIAQCRTITRTTNEFGEVETESTSSDDGLDDTKLDVAYERDKHGNVTRIKATDALGQARESTTTFDERGMFPITYINPLGHATKVEYDDVLGVLKKQIDPNGLTTERKYDSLGRLENETRPDGSQTTIKTARTKIDGIWRLVEQTTTAGGADDETIFDSLGRPIETYSFAPQPQNGDAKRIMQRIEYDRLSGNVARKSVPNAEGTLDAALQWDSYVFDALGREIRHTTPWNAVTTTRYDGLVVDSTDPLLKHTKTELDTLGRLKTITDAANGQTKYAYGPYDTLYTVTDPGGAITRWTRDAFGRVRQLDEPDRGTTVFKNNGFGDVVESTDALGRVATFDLDALGRVKTRTDKLGAQVLTTTWTWDTAPNGIGRLHMLTSPDGVKTYSYSKRGQLEQEMLSVGGESFVAKLGYDVVGHVKTVDYPQPLGFEPFGVTQDYDAHGYRIAVRDKETNDAFWTLKNVDQAGRYKEELFGNGTKTTRSYFDDKQTLKSIHTTFGASIIQDLSYAWDERLNLKSRTDARQPTNKTERFKYDALNRLTCAYFGLVEDANALCETSFGYTSNGNLTWKSDVGVLAYSDPKHPHAVTNAPGASYGHDAVSNQITRPGGVTITYTPFDLPKTITQGAKTTSFGYDGDEQRIRKTSSTSETLYFDDLYERVTTGANTEHRYYVHSPERAIAIVTRGGAEPGTKYLHTDHIGSIDVITKENGTIDERRSYDAFGARRNPDWGGPPIPFTNKTKKGFTGHEEDDEFGLVNMKGRLLDPRLGRFTTTDPVIANVHNGQSFAAYSYVRNNPLTLVDPSGFEPEKPPILPIMERVTTEADGSITVDLLYPPRAGQSQMLLPRPEEASTVGASAPSVDTSTTGSGGEGLPQETPSVEPIPARPDFWDGVADGGIDALAQLPLLVPTETTTVITQIQGTLAAIDAYKKGDIIDAINVGNPLMGVATLGFAIDDGDWYTVGRTSVQVGVTILAAIVGKKLAGGGGGRTTRGPPGTTPPGTGGGRGGNQFRGPDPMAEGSHSRFRTDNKGVTTYETYDYPTPGVGKRVDAVGPPHGGVPTPHTVETTRHINPRDPTKAGIRESRPRPSTPDEIPRRSE